MKQQQIALHTDSGVQPERTILAWERTMLAMCVVAAIYLRWSWVLGHWALVITSVMVLSGMLILTRQRRRYQAQSAGITMERVTPNVAGVLAIGAVIVTMGAVAVILVLWA